MATPPAKTEISGVYPNPSNAVARAGFGKLWETLFGTGGLLGATGNPADARAALGIGLTLLNVQTISASATYTPTPGTTARLIEMVGGGGSGAGVAATGAGQFAVSTGGSAGAFARVWQTGVASTPVAVTIGAGGAAVSGFASNAGNATSFGSLIVCPGGPGGGSAGPASGAFTATPAAYSGVPTAPVGTGVILHRGGSADLAFSAGAGLVIGSSGATSFFGAGGSSPGGAGGAAVSYGSGGGGCAIGSSTAAQAGGAGGNGVCIIYEYGAR